MDDWRELKLMVKALGGVARLTIVYLLAREDDVTVTALTDMLGLSQPLVSWHLRKLRRVLNVAIEQGWVPGPTIINSGIIIGGMGGQFNPRIR